MAASTNKSTYPTLLAGVSQQTPRQRLDGQCTKQINMVSDLVDGLGRRAGARVLKDNPLEYTEFNAESIFTSFNSSGDSGRHCIINTVTGNIWVYDSDWNLLDSTQDDYLIASTASNIQSTTLQSKQYITNLEKTPTALIENGEKLDPKTTGFFYIKASAYAKEFNISISTSSATRTVSYTTPSSGDVSLTTPEYVATQLYNQINGQSGALGIQIVRNGSYLSVKATGTTTNVNIVSSSGTSYIGASNSSQVDNITQLQPLVSFNGLMCAVGTDQKALVWYRYDKGTNKWLEDSVYGSISSVENILFSFFLYDEVEFGKESLEGRLSGDDETNENPSFLDRGLSGITSYQGRLVLLVGSDVIMSAAGKPLRFWRSTINSLKEDDRISIASGSSISADYKYGMQFNRDLILFSKSTQAVIPALNTAISPTNAQIVQTSRYASNVYSSPVDTGRSIMFPIPISSEYSGYYEMIPSSYTQSQYSSIDVTSSIPNYIGGIVVHSTCSSNVNCMVCVGSENLKELIVHQFSWDTENKLQAAWHKWTLPYRILSIWFSDARINILLEVDGATYSSTVVTIELKASETLDSKVRPLLDIYSEVTVTNGEFDLPVNLYGLVNDVEDIGLAYQDPDGYGGEFARLMTFDDTTKKVKVARNVPDGLYWAGTKFTSIYVPTPPVLRDSNGNIISADIKLLRYSASVLNTAEVNIQVDNSFGTVYNNTISPLLNASPDFEFDKHLESGNGMLIFPVGGKSSESNVTFKCNSSAQMRILQLDYFFKYAPKFRQI